VKLLEDVSRMNERVVKLQTHFSQANVDLDQLQTSTEKIVKRAGRIESLELDEVQAVARKPRLIK
jgi:DNA recombination protein RmuC